MDGFYSVGSFHGDPFSVVRHAAEAYKESGALQQFNDAISWFPIPWSALKPNPIHELLNHSDCDGLIEPEACRLISIELGNLIIQLENDGCKDDLFLEQLKKFMFGTNAAADANENLEFH